jgi:hypothetical protein
MEPFLRSSNPAQPNGSVSTHGMRLSAAARQVVRYKLTLMPIQLSTAIVEMSRCHGSHSTVTRMWVRTSSGVVSIHEVSLLNFSSWDDMVQR